MKETHIDVKEIEKKEKANRFFEAFAFVVFIMAVASLIGFYMSVGAHLYIALILS